MPLTLSGSGGRANPSGASIRIGKARAGVFLRLIAHLLFLMKRDVPNTFLRTGAVCGPTRPKWEPIEVVGLAVEQALGSRCESLLKKLFCRGQLVLGPRKPYVQHWQEEDRDDQGREKTAHYHDGKRALRV